MKEPKWKFFFFSSSFLLQAIFNVWSKVSLSYLRFNSHAVRRDSWYHQRKPKLSSLIFFGPRSIIYVVVFFQNSFLKNGILKFLYGELIVFMLFLSASESYDYDPNMISTRVGITNFRQKLRKMTFFSSVNSQAPELYRGPRARCARSGENGEVGVRSL